MLSATRSFLKKLLCPIAKLISSEKYGSVTYTAVRCMFGNIRMNAMKALNLFVGLLLCFAALARGIELLELTDANFKDYVTNSGLSSCLCMHNSPFCTSQINSSPLFGALVV